MFPCFDGFVVFNLYISDLISTHSFFHLATSCDLVRTLQAPNTVASGSRLSYHRDTIIFQLWIFRPTWLDHVTGLVMDCYNQKMAATCANSNVTSREKSSQSESAGTLCIVPLRSAPGCEFKSTKQRQAKLQKNRFTIKSFSIWIIHNRDNLSC